MMSPSLVAPHERVVRPIMCQKNKIYYNVEYLS